MKALWERLRHYISPVYLALLVAAFILWYIAKLSYTYNTEQVVRVDVDGQIVQVTCAFEGIGTNLFAYKLYANKKLSIPLGELKYKVTRTEEGEEKLELDPQSLQSAITVRFSDIKVISIRDVPLINRPAQP